MLARDVMRLGNLWDGMGWDVMDEWMGRMKLGSFQIICTTKTKCAAKTSYGTL